MKTHELKTDPDVFAAVADGTKTHEIRFNDRGFEVGDLLHLRETEFTGSQMHPGREGLPLIYTGREELRTVSHIQTGYGLADGWCILSFGPPALRTLDEYHEDDGPVVWWRFPVIEPSYIGTPGDDSWPSDHTHWTPHPPIPKAPS